MDGHLNAEAGHEAPTPMKELENLKLIVLVTRHDTLRRFNATSQQLKTASLDFNTAVKSTEALKKKSSYRIYKNDLMNLNKLLLRKCDHPEKNSGPHPTYPSLIN